MCLSPGGSGVCVFIPLVVPAFLAVAAGSAPVTLAVDGIEFLIPAKVYEIVH
jgi:hypothetical protein